MSERRYANCWSVPQRQQAEQEIEQICRQWLQHWLGETAASFSWQWNQQLFGSFRQLSPDPAQWQRLVAFAFAPDAIQPPGMPWLEQLAKQLEQDLAKRLQYSFGAEGQHAAWFRLRLAHNCQLLLPVPYVRLKPVRPDAALAPLSPHLLQRLTATRPVRLQVVLAAENISRSALADLRVGQILLLQQSLTQPLPLTTPEGVQLECYLGRRQDQQVLVMK